MKHTATEGHRPVTRRVMTGSTNASNMAVIIRKTKSKLTGRQISSNKSVQYIIKSNALQLPQTMTNDYHHTAHQPQTIHEGMHEKKPAPRTLVTSVILVRPSTEFQHTSIKLQDVAC